ncbi:MAG: formate dehydrogenase subunit alpha [Bacteroidales bacterium]|jgi:formate dehydrogenase major subunit|nr:formate dehydrogenase subunit alpha [Bacteroidales bacterium]
MDKVAYIDNKPFTIEEGETILQFVRRNMGSELIPTLCQADNLENYGSCRVCSVDVALKENGPGRVMASCHTPVAAGYYIYPSTEKIKRLRKNILELVLSEYPPERLTPEPGMLPTEFQSVVAAAGTTEVRYPRKVTVHGRDRSRPYVWSDLTECIKCYRCVRACDELQAEHVLGIFGRGDESRIIKGFDQSFRDSPCVSCGACVQTCPTNALYDRYSVKTLRADRIVRTTCTYCGVGCNLDVKVIDGQVRGIQAPLDGATNRGHTCLKGRYAFEFYNHPERLRSPLVRKNGKLTEVSWDEAYDYTARRFREIREKYGPDALAGISSARCTNEENYLMQKFFRIVIGTNNIDGCARVCHAPTAMGMQWAYGTGAATNSVDEIYKTGCILIIGANPSSAHPVTGARIRSVVESGTPLIVIDPLKIEIARLAKYHLQINPGTNVAVLNLFAYYLLKEGFVDKEFIAGRTEGWDGFRSYLEKLDVDDLERICGVDRELVRAAAIEYGSAPSAMEFHGLGVTEHWQATKAITLISNIAMMTGNIGREGTGVNPLRGQNNVQGAADMGVQPHQGAGYLDVTNPANIAMYNAYYGAEHPSKVGYRIPEMFVAAARGDLRALWIMGEDILQTDPNTCHVRTSLQGLELLVVQELFMTETARMADVIFPASSFLEKEGTFTNGERRIQKVQQVVEPLEGTKPDGQIVVDMMKRMGYPQKGYTADITLKEISGIVPFFKGVRWDELGDNGKQWPVKEDGTDTRILHTETFKRGLGRFHSWDYDISPELDENAERFPYILTTGRLLEHYNSGTMTRRTPNSEIVTEDVLFVHPDDAGKKGIVTGDFARIFSARGITTMKVKVTDVVKPGVIYTTFHFPEAAINFLTSGIGDEFTLTPEYKVVAVDFEKSLYGIFTRAECSTDIKNH